MRSILLSSAVLLAAATSARAACSDTLYLQSLTVYKQTLKNKTTLGTWDSVVVNPWDSLDLLKAGPIEAYGPNNPDTSVHVMRFQYDCGTDSVTSVMSARVVDKMVLSGEDYVHVKSSSVFSTNQKVVMLNGQGAGVDVKLETGTEHWSILWEGDRFEVGRKAAGQARISYDQSGAAYTYTSNKILTNYAGSYGKSLPFVTLLDDALGDLLDGLKDSVAHVGTSVDSVRIKLVRYSYVYDKAMPSQVGVARRSVRSPRFSVASGAQGWSIDLPRAAALSVVGIDGRTVRTFAPAKSVQWDGRDVSGVLVRPGIWYIHAQGIGSTPLLVR